MIDRLQPLLKPGQCAAVFSPENRRYYTGMNTSNGLLLATAEQAVFFTDFRYITAAKEKIEPEIPVRLFEGSAARTLSGFLAETGCREVLYEEDFLPAGRWEALQKEAPGISFTHGAALIFSPRRIKTPEELAVVRRAQKIADEAFLSVCDYIAAEKNNGLTEKQIAFFLEFEMRKNGSGRMPFSVIAASGKNSACPHAEPSDREIREGDFITMDFGATFDDYCSDMTRTVAVGHASEKQREVYEVVRAAQQAALDRIKAGMTGREVDAISREKIAEAGYGEFFGHALGHSVGLFIHEPPSFSPNCQEPILENTVISVEPGIYLPGEFGVRIEDLVVVKQDGVENLTRSAKSLLLL